MRDQPTTLIHEGAISAPRAAAWRRVGLIAAGMVGFTALTAAAAQWRLPLPFTPVPVTLQTAAVLLAGATLGPVVGAGSQALYLLAAVGGLPVLAGGGGLGLTAGYVLAFVPAAALVGIGRRRWGWAGMVGGMAVGSLLILVLGALGLHVLAGMGLGQAAAAGLLPFLPGDALKIAAVAGAARLTAPAWERVVRGRGGL
jgi:biotin transport system substrate-specific component